MDKDQYNIFESPFVLRVRPSLINSSSESFVLIHGWTGNEISMSVFQSVTPENALLIYPRGIIQIDDGKFGWISSSTSDEKEFNAFSNICIDLYQTIIRVIQKISGQKDQKINLIGFSQGASMSLVLSLLYPQSFHKIALLSGYLPFNYPKYLERPINQLEYYISHGTEDKIVEYSKALEIESYLRKFGAKVNLCTAKTAHRVSNACLREIKKFFEEN